MSRLVGSLVRAAVPLVIALVVAAPAAAGAVEPGSGSVPGSALSGGSGAPPASVPGWSAVEGVALQVAGAASGGSLQREGAPGAVRSSVLQTPAGPVSVSQQTMIARGAGGPVLLQVALLGGTQVVVDETQPGGGGAGTVLVVTPGTTRVASATVVGGAGSAPGGGRTGASAGSAVAAGPALQLPAVGGCFASPQDPTVVGSVFGPLIVGLGQVSCLSSQNLGAIVSIYSGGSQVGAAAGSSTTGTYLGVDDFAACSVVPWTNPFQTAELWSVNGVLQGGAASGVSTLSCA